MISRIEELNRLSLLDFKNLFASLDPPQRGSLLGIYKGSFIGPGWLRKISGPLLVLTRLGNWKGKDFDLQGNAINLVLHKGRIERKFPMHLVEQGSLIDHKPGIALQYAPENPFPWPRIIDELRTIREGLVLGMTITRIGPLQRLALPFALEKQDGINGL